MQTVRSRIVGRRDPIPGATSRLEFPTSDNSGDRLVGTLHDPDLPKPLLILLHGVAGCEDSIYLHQTAGHFVAQGFPVLRLNLRGAGMSAATCSSSYHAGCGRDLHDVLRGLPGGLTRNGVFVVGFSMGGTVLLNALTSSVPTPHVLGAATVSTPLCMVSSAQKLFSLRNRIYEKALLGDLIRQEKTLRHHNGLTDLSDLRGLRRIRAFDAAVTAPRHGFDGVEDYYRRTSVINRMHHTCVPILLVHSEDDPWIPAREYHELGAQKLPNLTLRLTARGGHVGFHFQGSEHPWYLSQIQDFLQRLMLPA